MVVIRGAVSTGDKRAHVKNCFRVLFIELPLSKPKVIETDALQCAISVSLNTTNLLFIVLYMYNV
jgi:hypothetical protein